MFGLIVTGRLVQTDFIAVDTNKFLITIPNADDINHIVVFMTGQIPFTEGTGGSVYFSWPNVNTPPQWLYLGFITNEKPSAIFKITKLKVNNDNISDDNMFGFQQPIVPHLAQIGISIEPLSSIAQMIPEASATVSTKEPFAEFAVKTAENLYNFCASFAQSPQQFMPLLGSVKEQSVVPLSTINQWYTNFMNRLQQNPSFWKN